MGEIIKKAAELGFDTVADGKNADDGKAYRPGAEAAKELGIVSPLYEAGMTKQDIRDAAKEMGLKTWDKASNSCLATRFPYDTELTEENFEKVEKAGFKEILQGLKKSRIESAVATEEKVEAPEKEVVTEQISGIDVMDLEDAVEVLWKNKIYAESGMGCTGPIVLVSSANLEKSKELLIEAKYISE